MSHTLAYDMDEPARSQRILRRDSQDYRKMTNKEGGLPYYDRLSRRLRTRPYRRVPNSRVSQFLQD